MAGWFTSTSPFEEQVEKATSSSLEDISLNLEISDLIRSKSVQPKDAMKVLKRRLENKNPNVQLATLNARLSELTDTCVKNGGRHFLGEIGSREFMDNLVSLLKAQGTSAVDEEVKTKMLELIQSWALAAQSRDDLAYVGETYRNLQREGFRFPPKTEMASTMLDSSAPPEWIDSDVCMRCRTAFTLINRKHHCRNCGNVFDAQCSSKSIPLPHLGIIQPVRVDDGCYAKLTSKSFNPSNLSNRSGARSPPIPKSIGQLEPRSGRAEGSFDEDLKRALQMSIEEAKGYSVSSSVPQPKPVSEATNARSNGVSTEDNEDADLKAAIEASLKDMEVQKRKHAAALKSSAGVDSSSPGSVAAAIMPKKDYELTAVEAENINLFSTLVDRLQHQPPGTILREPQIQELYESIGTLRPKLARTYGETMSKHDTLLELHAKLSTVVRYYDRMLEERLSNAYAQHTLGAYGSIQPSQTAVNSYTSLPPNVSDGRGAESFYFGAEQQGNPGQSFPPYQDTDRLQSTGPGYDHAAPPLATSGLGTYPPQGAQFGDSQIPVWNRSVDYNPHVSPSPSNAALPYSGGHAMPPGQPTSASYYNTQGPPGQRSYDQKSATGRQLSVSESSYSHSPVMRHNSQFHQQQSAAPVTPKNLHIAQPAADAMRSPQSHAAPPQSTYPVQEAPPGGTYHQGQEPTPTQVQPGAQPPQKSYYWQPPPSASQPTFTATPMNGSYINFTTAGPMSESSYHQQAAAQQAEESLIDL